MKNAKWLRPVAFTLMLIIAVLGVMQCYGVPRDDYYGTHLTAFDSEKKGMVDGVVIGTSVIAHAWIAPVAWSNHGIAAYHLSMSGQPFGAMTAYLDYALRKQDIKYAVIDIHGLRKSTAIGSVAPSNIKNTYLKMPDLISQYSVLNALFDYAEEIYEFYGRPKNEKNIVDRNDIAYYIPVINFHNRWVDGLNKHDFVTVKNEYLGADLRKSIFYSYDCSPYISNWNFGELKGIDEFQKNQLHKIFDYAEEHDIQLLFVNTPSFRNARQQQELHELLLYCKENGYDTIDFSTTEMIEKINLDLSKDFVDKGHLNGFGGAKVTDYICQYLIDNGYYAPDHKGDKKYAHWNKAATEYIEYFESGKSYWDNKAK